MSHAALVFTEPSAVGQRGAPSGSRSATSFETIGFVKNEPADQESGSFGLRSIPFAARSSRTVARTTSIGAFSPTAIPNLAASSEYVIAALSSPWRKLNWTSRIT